MNKPNDRLLSQMEVDADNAGVSLMPSAWPGMYPVVYYDADGCVLCAKCATSELYNREGWENERPVDCDMHYEGEPMICEECNAEIASAYGIPEESEK
jgi:hypothetical protein